MKRKIKVILLLVIIAIGCYLMGYFRARDHFREATKVMRVDTLVVRDTIRFCNPAEIRYEKLTEDLILPKVDTLILRDTFYLVVNKEVKEYRDSLYYIKVSGYQPNLDYVEVYPRTTTISKTETVTQPVTKRHGLALGFEANYSYAPYIPIYIEYSNMLHKNIRMYARVFYDFPTRSYGVGLGAKVNIEW